jgi:GrpB-like predicted nucleotidyltransferase (UPF0157 family)
MKEDHPRTITVVDYDPSWPFTFEILKSRVLQAIGRLAVSVEHVGSTSVPGLAAKPVIDMDVVVAAVADVSMAIERLSTLGYVHRGNLGIEGREAFYNPPGSPPHHLYVCVQGATALANHLTIRDYLRSNSAAARTYSTLKKQLAEMFPTDMDRYVQGKTDFLVAILRESGFSENALTAISDANATSVPAR